MKQVLFVSILGAFSLMLFSFIPNGTGQKSGSFSATFFVPEGWPQPAYDFDRNPLTPEKITLGRALFYDPKLSRDGSTSCASCHLVYTGFTHIDHSLSHGIEDRIGSRNTLAIINPAWQNSFMWDGGITELEKQPLAPLTSHFEMDSDLDSVLAYVNSSQSYSGLIKEAFGPPGKIATPELMQSLAQFMLQFNSYNSKYDKVMRQESGITFSEPEARGYQLFQENCSSCHREPLFTNQAFMSNGLAIDPTLNDGGRIKITGQKEDSLLFRVPTLRNIEVTYPYMHDGRFGNLQMVLNHYANQEKNPYNLSTEMGDFALSNEDKGAIIQFLKTLTDIEFLRNKELAFPRGGR